ncbi:MAG: hypothetical protein LBK99_26135, partial [Opitutaceae bacterium]|nr:hypothetical protein [Opitutaceae bacterium]
MKNKIHHLSRKFPARTPTASRAFAIAALALTGFASTIQSAEPEQPRLAFGCSDAGAIHIGDATAGDGGDGGDGLRIRENNAEVLLEFYTKTGNWEIQRQTKNSAWLSRAAEFPRPATGGSGGGGSGGSDTDARADANAGFKMRGMVLGNGYEMSAAPPPPPHHPSSPAAATPATPATLAAAATPAALRLSWTTFPDKKKQEYGVLNEAGFALFFEENAPVSVFIDGRKISLASPYDDFTHNRNPREVTVVFASGNRFSLVNFEGIGGCSLTHFNGVVVLGFTRAGVAAKKEEDTFGATLAFPAGAERLSPAAFRFTNSHDGWFPARVPVLGSAFDDVSRNVLDAPAGKHGFVIARDGQFQFAETGARARFNGVQLVHGAKFPTKENARILADRIAALGANAVRFHHIDSDQPGHGLWKRSELPAKHQEFDDELLDRMDYLISQFKQRGIYVHMDGITSVRFGTEDGFPDFEKLTFGLKTSAYLYDHKPLSDWQKKFFSRLWNHKNNYTGLAWKDDPVFASTEIVNENDPFTHDIYHHLPPPYRAVYSDMFRKWTTARNLPETGYADAPGELVARFKIQMMGTYYERIREHLRAEGVRIPVTGTNWMHGDKGSIAIVAANSGMDYTALHPYGGADCLQKPPHGAEGRSTRLALGKIRGRPFVLNEWNMTNTRGITRGAAIIWQIALAAAAGHDASYLFAFSHDGSFRYDASNINSLNVACDPAVAALFPAASILFLRGDIQLPGFEFVFRTPQEPFLNKIFKKNANDHLSDFSRAAFWAPTSIDYTGIPDLLPPETRRNAPPPPP